MPKMTKIKMEADLFNHFRHFRKGLSAKRRGLKKECLLLSQNAMPYALCAMQCFQQHIQLIEERPFPDGS